MSSETIYHRYRLKRRTTAGWAANNEVLLAGEPGIEVLVDGTEKIKYGDGVKTWSQLNYAAGGGGGAALSNATPQALGTAAAGTSAEGSRADHRHQMPNAAQVGADASGTAAAAVAAHAAAADPHPGYALESDSRLSDARTPTAHKANHATGGADALSPADIGAATAAQGAKADTAIQPGNAALSDAREWSAETISQAEAEAGTATIRRAFTAARVFQAVAAWWAGSAAKTKLDGIASGATANSPDAQLRDRTTHTGTQPASTITGLSTVATSGVYNDLSGKPDLSVKADLVNGLVPSSQLPAPAAALVQSVAGKTGNVTLTKGDVGLGNVDNTSDADKPVSTATATALGGKAGTGAIGSSGLTMATARLLGRTTAGAGAVEEIQVSGGTFTNGVLTLSGLPSSLTADANGNLTLTARWIQSTNGAASAPPMSLTGTWFAGGTSTTTKPQFLIEPAGTTSTSWSTAGTGLGVNAPSGFPGNLLDLQVNGSRQLGITIFGAAFSVPITSSASAERTISCGGASGYDDFAVGNLGLAVNSARFIGFSSFNFNSSPSNADVRWYRDAANTLAQRNGANAQTSRIYNTFTDASNYERLAHTWVSNVCYTRPENAGTGSARLYVPVTGGTTVSGLPAATPALTGARSFVTDANATTFMSTVAGGGSNRVPVVCDGTNWLIA